jgi:predicted nucleotidyltransferase
MFAQLLERLAWGLDQAGLPYMIIGGQAVLLYGEPRLTRDIDVTLGVDVDRLTELVALLAELRLNPLVEPESFTRRTMVLPCVDPDTDIRVDFIFSFTPYERDAIGRAAAVGIGGTQVRFATVEDLIVHKILASRPRDLEDVQGILLKQPHADLAAIRQRLTEFSQTLNQPLVEQFDTLCKEL